VPVSSSSVLYVHIVLVLQTWKRDWTIGSVAFHDYKLNKAEWSSSIQVASDYRHTLHTSLCTHLHAQPLSFVYGLFRSRLFSTEERVRLLHANVNLTQINIVKSCAVYKLVQNDKLCHWWTIHCQMWLPAKQQKRFLVLATSWNCGELLKKTQVVMHPPIQQHSVHTCKPINTAMTTYYLHRQYSQPAWRQQLPADQN